MLLELLNPMQNSLRNVEQIPEMVDFVRNGGVFTRETLSVFPKKKIEKISRLLAIDRIIKLVRFEDGALFIHDGLHRITSMWIAGRKYLDSKEFLIEEWKYEDYLEINLEQKWYTPFDPRIEVRIPHILPYKELVENFINKEPKPKDSQIRLYILDHYEAKSYTEPRSVKSIAEMASRHTPAIVGVE